jgi:hypothetical protein
MLCVLLLSSGSWSLAQEPMPKSSQSNQAKLPRLIPNLNRPASADQEYHFEVLRQPVELPNFPQYPAKVTFIRGLKYPNPRAGARIGMVFGLLEDPAPVLNW